MILTFYLTSIHLKKHGMQMLLFFVGLHLKWYLYTHTPEYNSPTSKYDSGSLEQLSLEKSWKVDGDVRGYKIIKPVARSPSSETKTSEHTERTVIE